MSHSTDTRFDAAAARRCSYPNCCCDYCNPFLYAERVGIDQTPDRAAKRPATGAYNWRADPTATFRFGVCLGLSPLILIVIFAMLIL